MNKEKLIEDVESLLRKLAGEIFVETIMTTSIEKYTQTVSEIFDSFEDKKVFVFLLLYRNIQICAQLLIKHSFNSAKGLSLFFSASDTCTSLFEKLLERQLSFLTSSELKFLQIKIKETITQTTKENNNEQQHI